MDVALIVNPTEHQQGVKETGHKTVDLESIIGSTSLHHTQGTQCQLTTPARMSREFLVKLHQGDQTTMQQTEICLGC